MEGGYFCLFAFSGIDFLLLISPYLSKHHKITRHAILSVFITGVFMWAVTLITICRFGPVNITNQMWPVLEMMDAIDLPGSFIERQEALIMSFWILSVFATVNAGLYFSSITIKSAVKKGKHAYYLIFTVIVTFLLSYLLKDINIVYKIIDLNFIYLGTAYMLVIPVVLLVIAKLRGFKSEKAIQ